MTAPQDDEFGPWQLHDGKGCPCVGQYVHLVYIAGPDLRAIAEGGPSWTYGDANDRRALYGEPAALAWEVEAKKRHEDAKAIHRESPSDGHDTSMPDKRVLRGFAA